MITSSRLSLTLAVSIATGCEVPAFVEGVFQEDRFAISSFEPLAREGGKERDVLVVIVDTVEGERVAGGEAGAPPDMLRSVNVLLRAIDALPLDAPIEIGTGAIDDPRPSVDVMVGPMHSEDRGDGVMVVTTRDPTRASSTGGSLVLLSAGALGGDVQGRFRADLDDGGWLEGTFLAPVSAD